MGWFKNIVLVAAYHDGYVNYESAKILYENKSIQNKAIEEMAKNIYAQIKADHVVKLSFYQPHLGQGMDYFLGREAHIQILDNVFLIHLVFNQVKDFLN